MVNNQSIFSKLAPKLDKQILKIPFEEEIANNEPFKSGFIGKDDPNNSIRRKNNNAVSGNNISHINEVYPPTNSQK